MAVQNLPFIENMETRIKSASLLLDGSLGHCFVAGLEHRDANAVYNCLRAYAAIDNTAGAEELFRTTVVSPMIQKIIPYGSSEVANGASSDELEEDYRQIMKSAEMECKFLLEISSSGKISFVQFNILIRMSSSSVVMLMLKKLHMVTFFLSIQKPKVRIHFRFPLLEPCTCKTWTWSWALFSNYPLWITCMSKVKRAVIYSLQDLNICFVLQCSAHSGLHVFDFLANSILKEVLLAIQKGKPGALSPGKPTQFLKNYKASLEFLAFLEGSSSFL